MNIEIFLNKIIKLIKNDDIIKKYLRKTAKTTGTRSAIRLEKEEKTQKKYGSIVLLSIYGKKYNFNLDLS